MTEPMRSLSRKDSAPSNMKTGRSGSTWANASIAHKLLPVAVGPVSIQCIPSFRLWISSAFCGPTKVPSYSGSGVAASGSISENAFSAASTRTLIRGTCSSQAVQGIPCAKLSLCTHVANTVCVCLNVHTHFSGSAGSQSGETGADAGTVTCGGTLGMAGAPVQRCFSLAVFMRTGPSAVFSQCRPSVSHQPHLRQNPLMSHSAHVPLECVTRVVAISLSLCVNSGLKLICGHTHCCEYLFAQNFCGATSAEYTVQGIKLTAHSTDCLAAATAPTDRYFRLTAYLTTHY